MSYIRHKTEMDVALMMDSCIRRSTGAEVGPNGTNFDSLFTEFMMSHYQNDIQFIASLKQQQGSAWNAINPESAARMGAQNRFQTGLDIARYTAGIMRRDMANYDADPSMYTQSLGCWHGFIGQQKM